MTTGRDQPWQDREAAPAERVEALLAELTIEEKVGQTHQVGNVDPERDGDLIRRGGLGSSLYASGALAGTVRDSGVTAESVDRVQRIAVEQSRLGIPLLFGRDVIHGHRTVFPTPLGLAATWDEELVERTAATAADEATVDGVAWTFAPMVDICEDPRWGRMAESLGEAPVLAGRLAAAMTRGFQGADLAARDRVAACVKHYAGYGAVAGGRDYDTVSLGENTVRNLHLRPFKSAVDAGVATVMAAFTDIDGVPMHAHTHLVREVLKGEWGFDGVVVGDWNGIGQLVAQGVAADLRDAARQAMVAGIDLDMVSGAYAAHLADLVASGEVPTDLLDDAVRRILLLKVRLGLFERPYVATGRTNEPTARSRALARRAAHASMVLVANNGVLPLSPGTVHLTGPFVDEGEALLGSWCLDGRGADVVSPATALRERLGDDLVVTDGRFSDRAVHLVRHANVTVALVGEHPWRSGEANSVTDIGLPSGQLDVLRQLAGIGKPLVVVVYTGRALDLSAVLELADAVVLAWHPGVEAGPALADLLFGDTCPSGRLPVTLPRSTGHLPTTSHQRPTGRPIPVERDRRAGRYLDALVGPLLPFGFGLSYTSVEYGEISVSATELTLEGAVELSVDVTNTGDRPCREVVQLYFRDPVAEVTRPLTELADWVALDLGPGETGTARFTVTARQFGYHGRDLRHCVDRGDLELRVGPDAIRGDTVTVTVR